MKKKARREITVSSESDNGIVRSFLLICIGDRLFNRGL